MSVYESSTSRLNGEIITFKSSHKFLALLASELSHRETRRHLRRAQLGAIFSPPLPDFSAPERRLVAVRETQSAGITISKSATKPNRIANLLMCALIAVKNTKQSTAPRTLRVPAGPRLGAND